MDTLEFNFNLDNFNKLFPFYILINNDLIIESFGKSLIKICPNIKKSVLFLDYFKLDNPKLDITTFNELALTINQVLVIECKNSKISIQGQFQINNNRLLFVGSPLFNSVSSLLQKEINFQDFALHNSTQFLLDQLDKHTKTVQALQEANKQIYDIALFSTQNPDPLIRIDSNGSLLKQNPAAKKLVYYIYNGHKYKNDDFFKFIITKINSTSQQFIFETESNQKHYSFLCIKQQKEKYINIYGRDITLQKISEQELNRLSLVASANTNGVVFTDAMGVIFWCNNSYMTLTGLSNSEIIGKTLTQVVQSKDTNIADLKKMTHCYDSGTPFEITLLQEHSTGNQFWSKNIAQPILNIAGQVTQYFVIIEDVTLKKRYDENLQNEKEKYQSIIANMNLGLLEVDANDVITLANYSFSNISGYTTQELIGKKAADLLFDQESKDLVKSKNILRKNGKTDSYEVKVIDKFGKIRHWLISGAPNYNAMGQFIGTIGIHLDITQKKELQEKQAFLVNSLAKSNAELEDYASVVSHDLKSPLRSIHSLITWIKEDNDKPLNAQTLEYLTLIETKVEKMDYLIDGILTYSKINKTQVTPEKVDTHQLIQNIIKIIDIPTHIKVQINGQLPVLNADGFRMQQLFQNIISNAVTYIDKPIGLVTVSCTEKQDNYLFAINDNGPGIAQENQEKIFKAFLSLQKTDKSTGLGLSIVKKIVDLYGGKIWLKSQENIGTTFYFTIPKNDRTT